MGKTKTNQTINKDGKILFFIDDGENWWYLGDSKKQVLKFHIDSFNGDDVVINKCDPVLIEESMKIKISIEKDNENGDSDTIIMWKFINNEEWNYENGVAMVASSIF